MKKLIKVLLVVLTLTTVVGCSKDEGRKDDNELVVAASLEPHATILEEAGKILKDDYDINLEVEVLDDYYVFNKSLDNGDVDANYFQHIPFFEADVETNGYDLVNIGGVHFNPFGFYSQTVKDVNDLKDGATIVISNSAADHGRILSILESEGLIKLNKDVKVQDATLSDIEENPKNFIFEEIKPELLVNAYESNSGDLVAINGNYAISAGLSPANDAVILEKASDDNPYVNIVAVKKGTEEYKKNQALIEVLQSEEIQEFISEKYSDGSVIPAKLK